MLDGIRLFVKNISKTEEEYLLNKFNFSATIDFRNGNEVGVKRSAEKGGVIWREAEHKSLRISLGHRTDNLARGEARCLKVCGSIHKFCHGGINSSEFSTGNALAALRQLSSDLDIDLSRMAVTTLEIGINLNFDFSVNEYIAENIIAYNQYPFSIKRGEFSLIHAEVAFTHYRFKLYAKDENLLRMELHYDDLQELREGGFKIYNAADLTAKAITKIAIEKLNDRIEKIVSLNGISVTKKYFPSISKKRERETLLRYANPLYWSQMDGLLLSALETDKKKYDRLRKQHQRGRRTFLRLVEEHGTGIQERVKQSALSMIEKMSQS